MIVTGLESPVTRFSRALEQDFERFGGWLLG